MSVWILFFGSSLTAAIITAILFLVTDPKKGKKKK